MAQSRRPNPGPDAERMRRCRDPHCADAASRRTPGQAPAFAPGPQASQWELAVTNTSQSAPREVGGGGPARANDPPSSHRLAIRSPEVPVALCVCAITCRCSAPPRGGDQGCMDGGARAADGPGSREEPADGPGGGQGDSLLLPLPPSILAASFPCILVPRMLRVAARPPGLLSQAWPLLSPDAGRKPTRTQGLSMARTHVGSDC